MTQRPSTAFVLFDAARHLRSSLQEAGLRVAATAPEDRAAFGSAWPSAILDALGVADGEPVVAVIVASDAAAFEPARLFLDRCRRRRCILIELATTADADARLDAHARLTRALLEEHAQLVLHDALPPDGSLADPTALAVALGVRRSALLVLFTAIKLTRSQTCHAVARHPRPLAADRLLEPHPDLTPYWKSTRVLHASVNSLDVCVEVAFVGAPCSEQGDVDLRAMDAGTIFRVLGVRVGPAFPGCPSLVRADDLPGALTCSWEHSAPVNAHDSRMHFGRLERAMLRIFDETEYAARTRKRDEAPPEGAPPRIVDADVRGQARLPETAADALCVIRASDATVGAAVAETIACDQAETHAWRRTVYFLRTGYDEDDVAMEMLARRARIGSAALRAGALTAELGRRLGRAAGDLSNFDIRLATCDPGLDGVCAAVRTVLARSDAFLVVDASHEPTHRAKEIRAALLRALPEARGRAVIVLDRAVAAELEAASEVSP